MVGGQNSIRALALGGGALLLLLTFLALTPPIGTRGEAREGLVIRDIARAGHWVLPERNGLLASKPPLYHWIAASLAVPFGLSDTVVRLPSVLAAVALVLLTAALGASIGGVRRGALAVGLLLGCFGFWVAASEARVDMLFASLITLSLAAFWRGNRVACCLGAAAATLTKGPAGVAIPGLVIVGFVLWQRDATPLRRLLSVPLLALAAAPVVVWYALAYHAGGDAFFAKQVMTENVDRFVGRGGFSHDRWARRVKLLGAFVTQLFPVNLAVIARDTEPGDAERASRVFLHAWWIGVLGFFLVAAGRRSVYLLPAYPPLALLAAGWLDRRPERRRAWVLGAIALADLAVAGATLQVRVAAARTNALVPFAARVRALVPADMALTATPGVRENDVLVLAYLLDRPIPRAKAACTLETAWLVPAPGVRRAPLAACVTVQVASGGSDEAVTLALPGQGLAAPGQAPTATVSSERNR
jgi:4-amino-4-deoxy-L-arabinose transferase-like glycosyltransferase